jgi:hypothetical protein
MPPATLIKQAEKLDQYYTAPAVALHCISAMQKFLPKTKIRWLEPSAGTGSFFNQLPSHDEKLGIDLEPKTANVITSDFLQVSLLHKDYVCIGNPPFGKNSHLAIKFFNHAAKFSTLIGFIVPRTFSKSSVKNRLNLYFNLVYEEVLPLSSFIFEDKVYEVPCVFQIWKKTSVPRVKHTPPLTHQDLVFCTPTKSTIGFQRVGVQAGTIKSSKDLSTASHYFIKCSSDTVDILKKIDWSIYKHNTAGNPSISKRELISAYTKYLYEHK